jgi:hypothetical protein
MMFQTTTRKIDVYEVEIADVEGKFKMSCELNRIEKDVLMTLPNPRYKELIRTYEHLRGVHMNDGDEKALLPVHLILGAVICPESRHQNQPGLETMGCQLPRKPRWDGLSCHRDKR